MSKNTTKFAAAAKKMKKNPSDHNSSFAPKKPSDITKRMFAEIKNAIKKIEDKYAKYWEESEREVASMSPEEKKLFWEIAEERIQDARYK